MGRETRKKTHTSYALNARYIYIYVYIYAFIVCVLCVYVRMSGIAHGLHALFVFATNKFSMLRRSPASTPLPFVVYITHILFGLHTVTPNFKFKPTQQQQRRQIFVYVFASFVLHTIAGKEEKNTM